MFGTESQPAPHAGQYANTFEFLRWYNNSNLATGWERTGFRVGEHVSTYISQPVILEYEAHKLTCSRIFPIASGLVLVEIIPAISVERIVQHRCAEYKLRLPLVHPDAQLVDHVLGDYIALLDIDPVHKRQPVDDWIFRAGAEENTCIYGNKDEKLSHQELHLIAR